MNQPDRHPPPRTRGILPALWTLVTPPAFEPVVPVVRGLPYAPGARGVAPLLDVYLPAVTGPLPSVLLVHGGGFVIGSRTMKVIRFLAAELCRAGFAVAACDYRLVFRGGRLDEAQGDVSAAVRAWRGWAARFDLDPRRMSLVGISAGAALTLLVAAGPEGADLHRVASLYGVYDFAYLRGASTLLLGRLLFRTGDRRVWAARSPLARADYPGPLLLVHGDADTLVPIAHMERLARRRQVLGLPTEVMVHPGEPHAFLNDATRAASVATVRRLVGFLTERPTPAPPRT